MFLTKFVLVSGLGMLPVFAMGSSSARTNEPEFSKPSSPSKVVGSLGRAGDVTLSDIVGSITFPPVPFVTSDEFGTSLALFGDYVLVGAPRQGIEDKGAAYLFGWDPVKASWNPLQTFAPTQLQKNDYFGFDVALGVRFAAISAIGDK